MPSGRPVVVLPRHELTSQAVILANAMGNCLVSIEQAQAMGLGKVAPRVTLHVLGILVSPDDSVEPWEGRGRKFSTNGTRVAEGVLRDTTPKVTSG